MIAVSLRQQEHDLDDVFLWTSLYVRAIPWIPFLLNILHTSYHPSTQRYLVVTAIFELYLINCLI
jgi:hypothetical protein